MMYYRRVHRNNLQKQGHAPITKTTSGWYMKVRKKKHHYMFVFPFRELWYFNFKQLDDQPKKVIDAILV